MPVRQTSSLVRGICNAHVAESLHTYATPVVLAFSNFHNL
jgi:hypothetical protein